MRKWALDCHHVGGGGSCEKSLLLVATLPLLAGRDGLVEVAVEHGKHVAGATQETLAGRFASAPNVGAAGASAAGNCALRNDFIVPWRVLVGAQSLDAKS